MNARLLSWLQSREQGTEKQGKARAFDEATTV